MDHIFGIVKLEHLVKSIRSKISYKSLAVGPIHPSYRIFPNKQPGEENSRRLALFVILLMKGQYQ